MYKAVLLMVTTLWMLFGCEESVSDWPAREAQIVEAGTGKPLAGVIVVALWKGTASYSNTVCFHVETATTDEEGGFRIPAWTNTTEWRFTENQWVDLIFYKAGYEESEESSRTHMPDQALFSLRPFTGSVDERLEYLLEMADPGCLSEEYKELIVYNEALYREARAIGRSEHDKKSAERLLFYLNVVQYGWDQARDMKKKY